MKKHLSLIFIILIFFWNAFFFPAVISDLKQSPSKQSLYEGLQVNIPEENLLESVWQPIEDSFNFNFSNEKSVDVTNGTSIVEYDINLMVLFNIIFWIQILTMGCILEMLILEITISHLIG